MASENSNRTSSGAGLVRGKRLRAAVFIVVAGLLTQLPGFAQEGHPLKGSWLGTWESNETHGENVLVILDWDGENITGMLNPGTDNIAITDASLDPDGWVVRIEAEAPGDEADASGAKLHYEIEGRIENLELPNRSIVGTWKNERGEGAFDVSRQ